LQQDSNKSQGPSNYQKIIEENNKLLKAIKSDEEKFEKFSNEISVRDNLINVNIFLFI